ncbi:zf-HC2 domain-containing protein [Nocardia panacis]|uniref:Zf-HC2 domain-containing protein n=1 Tax=Nocardia panacis TaxID=2340916 RepID=A0A3A4KGT0_9NOCA|nr:zf-HC2 domain-containing protein [Nocardia panacis]RJO75208.1 zf-HC2 domain-containing protein [Nocardia panacis]
MVRIRDVHSLAAAFVLNALPEDECAEFEAHLAHCPLCGDEVDGMWAAVAHLIQALARDPDPAIRARLVSRLADRA